jgi:PAS domain S-box-containing protein
MNALVLTLQDISSANPDVLLVSPPSLIEILPIGIYACNAQGRLCWCNRRAAALWGRSPRIGDDTERFCGSHMLYSLDGRLIRREETPMAQALRSGEPIDGEEAVVERPDGSRIVATVHINPLKDARGNVVGAINCFYDITAIKEAETQQRLLFAELNHRTKNNMQILHALLCAARRDTTHPEARAALDGATQRIGAMAAAQTVLYRASNVRAYQARAFLDAVCGSLGQAFGASIGIHCEAADAELPNDTAAPLALILNELVTNAAKHGADEHGEAAIRVSLIRDGREFLLRVEDGGPGFDLASVCRRSSGLGLVVGLVGQIGGTFKVERTPGACCTVRFPDASRPPQ